MEIRTELSKDEALEMKRMEQDEKRDGGEEIRRTNQ